MKSSAFVWLFLCVLSLGCTRLEQQGFTLHIDMRNANPGSCYLYRLSLEGGDPVLIDSFQIQTLDQQVQLLASGKDTAMYQLTVVPVRTSYYFISDASAVWVQINATDPQAYIVKGSPGSVALQQLQHIQKGKADSLYILNNKLQNGVGDATMLQAEAARLRTLMNQNFLAFADTTTAPLAALLISQQIDFEGNIERQKLFASGLQQRFPEHKAIQGYVRKMQDYFSLLEVEYQVGDRVPEAIFKDTQGKSVATASWNGNYYLLEFWSAYCPACLESLYLKKSLYQKYHSKGFEMLALSLDEDARLLEVEQKKAAFPWPVIADLKGWSGQAAQTYKIDSIPYNMLIGPDGRVVEKNITPKALDGILSRWKGI